MQQTVRQACRAFKSDGSFLNVLPTTSLTQKYCGFQQKKKEPKLKQFFLVIILSHSETNVETFTGHCAKTVLIRVALVGIKSKRTYLSNSTLQLSGLEADISPQRT